MLLAQYNYVKMQPSPSGSVETWLWVDGFKTAASSWVSGDTLPYIGHVDNPYNPSQDLAFGIPRQIYFALPDGQAGFTPYTNNNLFNTYWRNYIEEIASKEAMQVEATFLLTVTDIATLDFRLNCTVAGSWTFQFAQVTSNASASQRLSGSYIEFMKVA